MKTGTGAKFTCEAGIDPAGNVGAALHFDETKFVREVRIGLLQPIEVIGDGEVLGHIALPGRHCATIGLGPMRHDVIPVRPYKSMPVRTEVSRVATSSRPRPLEAGIVRTVETALAYVRS